MGETIRGPLFLCARLGPLGPGVKGHGSDRSDRLSWHARAVQRIGGTKISVAGCGRARKRMGKVGQSR
jgi:hypothetical protein